MATLQKKKKKTREISAGQLCRGKKCDNPTFARNNHSNKTMKSILSRANLQEPAPWERQGAESHQAFFLMLSVTLRGAYRDRMGSRLAAHMDSGPIDYGASRRA